MEFLEGSLVEFRNPHTTFEEHFWFLERIREGGISGRYLGKTFEEHTGRISDHVNI